MLGVIFWDKSFKLGNVYKFNLLRRKLVLWVVKLYYKVDSVGYVLVEFLYV